MKKIVSMALALAMALTIGVFLTGCDEVNRVEGAEAARDKINAQAAANKLHENQPAPTDIEYSLERYNLIRRAYWVNGQREKANTLPCEIEKPLGHIVLFSGNVVVGKFVVDGKVSSLNSFLTPDSEYYEENASHGHVVNAWLADVDGSYGENDSGIFFFTPDGKYIEWSGDYLYSDIPFEVDSPILNVTGGN